MGMNHKQLSNARRHEGTKQRKKERGEEEIRGMEQKVYLCRAVSVSVINGVIASNSLGSVNMV